MPSAKDIAVQLKAFQTAWPKPQLVADPAGARAAFAKRMGSVEIFYNDDRGSKERNAKVRGVHIGEILEMLHTLNNHRKDLPVGRFLQKLDTLIRVLGGAPDEEKG